MLNKRRDFLRAMACTTALAATPFGVRGEPRAADWREAFKGAGFDVDEDGNAVFVVCGDVHEPEYSTHLEAQIDAWNAMRPAPRFVALLGDNVCSVSRNFGHTPDAKGLERARAELMTFREKISRLRNDIALKLVIGNHDTMPGEVDAAFFRSVVSSCVPYEAFDEFGIRFMIWNGGHDGSIDERQRTWIRKECERLPLGKTAVVLVHQPSLGMTERERGVPAAIRDGFSGHVGPLWLLAGHVHVNRTNVFSLPKTKVVQVAHAKGINGYWIYGMRGGRIVARVFCDVAGGVRVEGIPDLSHQAPSIPLPFENRKDVVWRLLIGDDPQTTQKAFVSGKGGDCGTWWFYVDELVYRLPLAEKGVGATRFAVLAALGRHRKTGEPVHVLASGDGLSWTQTPLLNTEASVNLFAIPEPLRNSRDLYVKVKSYGFGADTCVGGFALCR